MICEALAVEPGTTKGRKKIQKFKRNSYEKWLATDGRGFDVVGVS